MAFTIIPAKAIGFNDRLNNVFKQRYFCTVAGQISTFEIGKTYPIILYSPEKNKYLAQGKAEVVFIEWKRIKDFGLLEIIDILGLKTKFTKRIKIGKKMEKHLREMFLKKFNFEIEDWWAGEYSVVQKLFCVRV